MLLVGEEEGGAGEFLHYLLDGVAGLVVLEQVLQVGLLGDAA